MQNLSIQKRLVKNFTTGRYGYRPEAIVIHIAEGYLTGAESWFNNPDSKVSSHYMIGKKGEIWQFVEDSNTAWHAGGIANPSWPKLKPNINPNLYTIGIEHEGFTGEIWTNEMFTASAKLIANLCEAYSIPLRRENIIGHYEINSLSRKNCPGTGVNFDKLILEALKYYEDPKMIKELQDQINNLNSQLNQLKTLVSKYKSDIDKLTAENTELKSKLSSVSTGSDLQKTVLALKEENLKLQRDVRTALQEKENLTNLVVNLRAEIDKLKSDLSKSIGDKSVPDLFSLIFKKVTNR